jgi:ABC-type transport system involved in multi-copper enzyme maturation permease subunit
MTKRLSASLEVAGWLVRDTFRLAFASRLSWAMLGVTALCVALCLSAGLEGDQPLRVAGESELFGGDGQPLAGPNPRPGRLTLAFGSLRVDLFRDGRSMVEFFELMMAKWVAGAVGTMLALIGTAGFLPDFLRPRTAALVFSKPEARWRLLLGKAIGVLVFVALQASLFVGGTWLALGLKTGYWMTGYLWSVPLLLLHFAVVYSVSALLAVTTRSTVVCVFGSLVIWFLCFAVNYGRHATIALPETARGTAAHSATLAMAVEVAYWALPKPTDMVLLLDQLIRADHHFQPVFPTVTVWPAVSLASSLLFAAILFAIAAREIESIEY